MFVTTSALSISMPAHAKYCTSFDSDPECFAIRESNARAEFMKQEAELMRQKSRILKECGGYAPPSWCKDVPKL